MTEIAESFLEREGAGEKLNIVKQVALGGDP